MKLYCMVECMWMLCCSPPVEEYRYAVREMRLDCICHSEGMQHLHQVDQVSKLASLVYIKSFISMSGGPVADSSYKMGFKWRVMKLIGNVALVRAHFMIQ